MNIEISETYLLIRKNKDWLELNADKRNTVYYQMVENSLNQLEEHLDFLEQYQGLDS
jgi:bacterioferritin (cytochrome b1)